MDKQLEGKTAMITGAGGGVGRQLALLFARNGANVVILDVNADTVTTVAAEVEAAGGHVLTATDDIRDSARIRALVDQATARFGGIDVLVNNAGIWGKHTGKSTEFAESEESTWDWILGVNVKGTMICTRTVLPQMIERGRGKIINLGSVAGVCGLPRMVDYSASKGAIIAMTKALAIEVGKHNIQVNCISPGSIELTGTNPPTLLGRSGDPAEVAELALFLASEHSNFITGQNHVIDGGRVLSTRW